MRERVYKIIERKVKKGDKTVTLIYAKTTYTDRQGVRHGLWRAGENRTEARNRLKAALAEVLTTGDAAHSVVKTFAELARYYEQEYVKPAEYQGDVKIAGLRSHVKVKSQMKPLVDYFGRMHLREMTGEDIRQFKQRRLALPVKYGTDKEGNALTRERSIASVNRELALLRRVLNVALSRRWITENPFSRAGGVISLAGEVFRQRILTPAEEQKIFAACEQDARRAHLKPVLMCLMDTGMRRNEALRLVWRDIDFESGIINVTSFKGKKRMVRAVAMTRRLRAEMEALYKSASGKPGELVFGVVGDIKRSWTTVRALAGLKDVRLHDLRHQAATNFIRSGLSLEETGKLLGHLEPRTTYKYVAINDERAQEAAAMLDRLHEPEARD